MKKTLKVKMKTCIAGIDWVYKVGDVVDMKERQAMNLVNSGQAELVKSAPKIETAESKPSVEIPEAKPKRKPRNKAE